MNEPHTHQVIAHRTESDAFHMALRIRRGLVVHLGDTDSDSDDDAPGSAGSVNSCLVARFTAVTPCLDPREEAAQDDRCVCLCVCVAPLLQALSLLYLT